MDRSERLGYILRTLERDKASSVTQLAGDLGVSHMTIRRDLVPLVNDQKVKILHGSVILHPNNDARGGESYYSLIAAGAKFPEQKRQIGLFAASMIEPDDALIIDSGSTTEYFAKNLPRDRHYTALCCALNILSELVRRKNCTSIFTGGIFHENTLMFESPEGLAMIHRFRATKAFMSAAGASARFGVTCMNSYERETKMAMMESSLKKILLLDSSKFGMIRSDFYTDLAAFDEIVTDAGISAQDAEVIRGLGITLSIAPE